MSNALQYPGFEGTLAELQAVWAGDVDAQSYVSGVTDAHGGTHYLRLTKQTGGSLDLISQPLNGVTSEVGVSYAFGAFFRLDADNVTAGQTDGLFDFSLSERGGGATAFSNVTITVTDPVNRLAVARLYRGTTLKFTTGVLDLSNWKLIYFTHVAEKDGLTLDFTAGTRAGASPRAYWNMDDAWGGEGPFYTALRYPENSRKPQQFKRSIVDPLSGTMVSEDRIVIDQRPELFGRMRGRDLLDQPGRDELLAAYDVLSPYDAEEP